MQIRLAQKLKEEYLSPTIKSVKPLAFKCIIPKHKNQICIYIYIQILSTVLEYTRKSVKMDCGGGDIILNDIRWSNNRTSYNKDTKT